MPQDPMATEAGHKGRILINGIRVRGEGADRLGFDLTDPVAVLALKLVAESTGALRDQAARRSALIRRFEIGADRKTDTTRLDRPDAIPSALNLVRQEIAGEERSQATAEGERGRIRQQGATIEEQLDGLRQQRTRHSAMLWWLGIGWLLWRFSGNQDRLRQLISAAEEERAKETELTRMIDALAQRLSRLKGQLALLEEVSTVDQQPVQLMRHFGWTHVPLQVMPAASPNDRLVFTTFWARNFTHELPDIRNGLERVDALHRQILVSDRLPVLLSPDPDLSPTRRGMIGEEAMLARDIEAFTNLAGSAEVSPVEAALLPADPVITRHLCDWPTSHVLSAGAPHCLLPPESSRVDRTVAVLQQIRTEEQDPNKNVARLLSAAAATLRGRSERFATKRSDSIEALMGSILSEWSGWTTLPLRRRYCPSFHRSSTYRYHRLGFKPEEAFDEDGRFLCREQLDRLPQPATVKQKLKEYTERLEEGVADESEMAAERDEILHLIRVQAEGSIIVPLTASARLHYNATDRRWQCGLCLYEPRIGGPGTSECHLGCPNKGLFTDEESRMAQQYVQYEDLMSPMFDSLWHEKSTYDEVNRVIREKEAELRRNVLEEQQALRDEARIFKEAARDRVVKLEDIRGQAKELVERFRAEMQAAYALGTLDAHREQELQRELKEHEEHLASMGQIVLKTKNHEDRLATDVDTTLERRQVVLEERIRRSSDAPEFVLAPHLAGRHALMAGKPAHLSAAATKPAEGNYLLVRRPDDTGFNRRAVSEIVSWLREPDHAVLAGQLEASDGESGWYPLPEHPMLRSARATDPQEAAISDGTEHPPLPDESERLAEPPPLPKDD